MDVWFLRVAEAATKVLRVGKSTPLVLIGGGAAMGFSLAWGGAWPLSLLGAALFLSVIEKENHVVRRIHAALLFSVTAYGIGLMWGIASAWPFTWVGEANMVLAVLFASLAHLGWVLSLAVGFALVWGIPVWGSVWTRGLLYTALWVIAEVVAALSMSLVVAGAGAGPHMHMTLHMAGFGIAGSLMLAQFSSVGGVYLLSAGVAAGGWLLVLWSRKNISLYRLGAIGGVLYCIGAGLYLYGAHEEARAARFVSVMAASTELGIGGGEGAQSQQVRDILEGLALLSPEQGATLLLPERIKFMYIQDSDLQEKVSSVLSHFNSIVEQRGLSEDGKKQVSVIEVYYPGKNVIDTYTKELLVPLGEYLPTVVHAFLSVLGREDVLQTYAQGRNFRARAQEMRNLPTLDGGAVKSCYEVISPSLYRGTVAQGATYLLNTASHSTFYGHSWAFSIAERAARLRAIETRRFYVQATNMGPAIAIHANGDLAAKSYYPGIYVRVPVLTHQTPYVRGGAWVVWVALSVLAGFFSTQALRRSGLPVVR